MKTYPNEAIKEAEVPAPVEGVKIRWLITEETGAPNFAMRQFTVAPGGSTPQHTHSWEHEAYILEGSGTIQGGEEVKEFKELRLLTAKPVLYVCNVDEAAAATGNAQSARIEERARAEGAQCVVISAALEAEIAQLGEAGKLRLEGRDYVVKDGDVLHIRFNV